MSREEFIARVRYLGWICYQMGADLPLHDVPDDFSISEERLESLIDGTHYVLEHQNMTAEDNHKLWMQEKLKQWYSYDKKLSVEDKTHPSLIPFNDLPDVEKRKDEMDLLMVRLANELYDTIKEKS